MAILFKGFSTADKIRAPYTLVDSELVKRDLLNQLYTKKGERVMRPEYGTIIYDLLMDPNIPELEEIVKEDIERIIDGEPRATLDNINILIGDHSIRAEVTISYVMLSSSETLFVEYISQSGV
jgi:phage baseplate assembly protein W